MTSTRDQNLAELLKKIDKRSPDEIFTLGEQIAQGGFGAVYEATHKVTSEALAVKVLALFEGEEDQTKELLKEINIMSECNHENVVKYHGSFVKDFQLYVVMERCQAGALNEIYSDMGEPFTEKQIAYIMRESLKGLAYLHSKGIIHRDIKGGNILLDKYARVKLIDFGTCGRIDSKNRKRVSFVGTPYWMAPEVIDNGSMQVPYDETADVWSLGVTAIECAQCDPPWSEMHPMRALFVIPASPPPKLKDPTSWSDLFHDFLATCLVKDPKLRPTCEEVLQHPFVANAEIDPDLVEICRQLSELDYGGDGAGVPETEQSEPPSTKSDTPSERLIEEPEPEIRNHKREVSQGDTKPHEDKTNKPSQHSKSDKKEVKKDIDTPSRDRRRSEAPKPQINIETNREEPLPKTEVIRRKPDSQDLHKGSDRNKESSHHRKDKHRVSNSEDPHKKVARDFPKEIHRNSQNSESRRSKDHGHRDRVHKSSNEARREEKKSASRTNPESHRVDKNRNHREKEAHHKVNSADLSRERKKVDSNAHKESHSSDKRDISHKDHRDDKRDPRKVNSDHHREEKSDARRTSVEPHREEKSDSRKTGAEPKREEKSDPRRTSVLAELV
eukprot:TRINITY_DN2346_c0_g1_i5.p1 TRINITY_DN2346_c0_g1~~TRINITY_DN2346_c0_g1_i5.p1  ORF type:complete len:614 (-),score=133.24 TRINITY_DN2346_c0_g1_i5:221-2062(-)